jgi:hypothetical protein
LYENTGQLPGPPLAATILYRLAGKELNTGNPSMKINLRAGQLANASDLVDVPKLLTAYYEDRPDPHVPAQRVVFGTSGHRGSSFDRSFNEWHILAITQAICLHRRQQGIDGPLFLGIDTHALSRPALASALEVLAANGIDVMLAEKTTIHQPLLSLMQFWDTTATAKAAWETVS